ncbi:MAG TPA: FimV/HubP family polar landmark protein [Limnobacter sp.]|nr:FimV/HubP family polar landmark protein [Limnobacter sp.]
MFASSLAQAAQLGKLEVLSRAGEPFQAQIQIDSMLPEERATLKAALAPPEAFQAARLVVDPNLQSLRFSVQDGAKPGTAVVKITASKALPQGFLDALVELSWAGGRVAREYTLTIPADAAPSKPETTQLPAITPPRTLPPVAPVASPKQPEVQAASPSPAPSSAPAASAIASPAGQLQVKRGDTLSELAVQLVGDGVTLNQAMAAIYEENRDAFIKGSVHLIREGAQIRIPNRSAVRARSAKEALLVLARNDDRNVYSAYARQIGLLTVANATASDPGKTTQGSISPKEPTAEPAAKPEDRLQIAPGAAQGGNASDAVAEELLAKNKALAEANERIALLEKNVSDLQKLLEMQQGTQPASTEALPALSEQAPSGGDSNPTEDPLLSAPADAPLSPPANEAVSAIEDASKDKPQDTAGQLDSPEEGSLVPWLLAGAGGLLGLVLLLLVVRARKKSSSSTQSQEPSDESFTEVQDFDNALAAMAAEQTSTKPEQGLSAVSDDDFNLDDVLAERAKPVAEPAVEPSQDAPSVEESLEQPVEQIPELQVESPQASEQAESLNSPVTLEFPEEAAKQEQASSIFDDLDSLEKGAAAAQEELEELRKLPPTGTDDESSGDSAGFDSPANEEPSPAAEASADPLEPAAVDLDVDVPNPKIDEATWQEVATKLDLAGAYVEIGDADGAKELLNEIIKKGDADQVRKAKALLGTLG